MVPIVPPRVSVLVVCKNAARTIGRCIDSLVRQEYANLHIVVQDGASTDGTLELLRAYGDRLDLVSETDADQNEGFVKGLQRCTGDIVGFCWADEELLPGAVAWAVAQLGAEPALGAIYGCFVETDLDGHGDQMTKYPAWDFAKVYTYEFIPPVCASFFRRPALAATYLRMWDVAIECTEYLLWASVGSRYPVRYVEHPVAKYARHPGQLSLQPDRMHAYPAKIVAAIEGLAARSDMPPIVRELRGRACANVHLWAAQWLLQECGLLDESHEHLVSALRYTPEASWLSTMVWNCLRLLLTRGEGARAVGWLDAVAAGGIRIVGGDYARAIALAQMGWAEDAAEAATRVVGEPHPAALLQLVPELVRSLRAAGRPGDATACLDLFWRQAGRAPQTYLGLALVLAELLEFADALRAIECLLAIDPGNTNAQGVRTQLQIICCACHGSPAANVAALEEAKRTADLVWRAVREPELITRLSPAGAALLGSTIASLIDPARALGFPDLLDRLERLSGSSAGADGGVAPRLLTR